MTQWRALRQLEPKQAIDALRERFAQAWPYALVEEPPAWTPSDSFRSQMAYSLSHDYDPLFHWPAALSLLIPPYPKDTATCLNLLNLAHVVSDNPEPKFARDVISRATAMLATHSFGVSELVAFETVNLLGGIEEQALLLRDAAEQNTIAKAIRQATDRLKDEGLRHQMSDRALPTVQKGRLDTLAPDDASATEAAFRALAAQTLRAWSRELGKPIQRTTAILRAFAESQVHPATCLGSATIRVSGDTDHAFGSTFATIDRCLKTVAEFLGQDIFVAPATLVDGSVEIVCRLESQGSKDAEDAAARTRFASEIVQRLELILTQGSQELVPSNIGRLLGELWESGLSLDLEFRDPDGSVHQIHLDKKRIAQASTGPRTRFFGMIKSIDVPQANALGKVFYVAEVHVDGKDVKTVGIPDVGDRQWDYYRHAARILGLISPSGAITPAGLQLVRTESNEERVRRAAFLFESCELGQAWLNWAGARSVLELKPDKALAEKFVRERTEAGGSTTGRRADCLVSWLTEFQSALHAHQ